jgi:hypothetical protein
MIRSCRDGVPAVALRPSASVSQGPTSSLDCQKLGMWHVLAHCQAGLVRAFRWVLQGRELHESEYDAVMSGKPGCMGAAEAWG